MIFLIKIWIFYLNLVPFLQLWKPYPVWDKDKLLLLQIQIPEAPICLWRQTRVMAIMDVQLQLKGKTKALSFFFFLASKYIFFPNWLFPIWYIKDYLELDNPQDWISLLLTKTFWWMVLSYIFLSSTNIFLKHSIQSYYWDSSLSEIKSLFYLLSVLASRMYPSIFDFKNSKQSL